MVACLSGPSNGHLWARTPVLKQRFQMKLRSYCFSTDCSVKSLQEQFPAWPPSKTFWNEWKKSLLILKKYIICYGIIFLLTGIL